MKLLILMACLGIERYLHIGSILKRFSWFDAYLKILQNLFSKNSPVLKGYLGIFLVVFPIFAVIGGINFIITRFQYGLSGVGLSFIVLIYCFGPGDLYSKVQVYVSSVLKKDDTMASAEYQDLTGEMPQVDERTTARKLTEMIFVLANDGFFSVVFWYMFLGPLGVIIYRLVFVIAKSAEEGKELCVPMGPEAIALNNWLSWIPARIGSLLYIFSAGFQGFSTWREKALSMNNTNEDCLKTCGLTSLSHVHDKELPAIEENKKAIFIVDRSLVIALVVIAVFSLGAWIN